MDPLTLYYLTKLLESVFLLPLQDRRERERGFPWMTLTMVVINVLIHVGLILAFYWRHQTMPDEVSWVIALYPLWTYPVQNSTARG